MLCFFVLLVFSFFASYYQNNIPYQVLAQYGDGDSDSDSDSDGETTGTHRIPNPNDPKFGDYIDDLNNAVDDPSRCPGGCSYWEGDELVKKDENGDELRRWVPFEPFIRDRDGDSDSDGGETCTVFCLATTAPNCGGACSGCYRSQSCESWDVDKPGCTCWGPPEDRNCSGSYCAEQCSDWRVDD